MSSFVSEVLWVAECQGVDCTIRQWKGGHYLNVVILSHMLTVTQIYTICARADLQLQITGILEMTTRCKSLGK